MKYFHKICYIIVLVFTISLMVSAADVNTYIYEYPAQSITVIFEEDTCFTADARLMIADSIVHNTPISQTYSMCWLLGHDYYIDSVGAIYHKRSEYDPRCQYELYDVKKCTNCDYTNPTLVSSQYVSCCPPEASAVSIDDSHTH